MTGVTGMVLGSADDLAMDAFAKRRNRVGTASSSSTLRLVTVTTLDKAPLQDNLERDSSQLIVVVTPHIVRRRQDLVAGPRIPLQTTQ